MAQQVCPLLCTLDAGNRRGPHVEFPSFENQCLASGIPELILLGDQATSCLSAAHAACPRFRASRHSQEGDAPFVPFFATAEDAWQQQAPAAGIAGLGSLGSLGESGGEGQGSRARWGRLGAALIFLSVLLCGSFTAAYTGWDWITRDLRTPTAAGRVDMAAAENAAPAAPTPAVYVVMTATPIQVAVAAPSTDTSSTNTGIIPVLPAAVTPTPIRVEVGAPAVITPQPAAPAAGDPVGDPAIDVGLLVPTRRPTPEFDVPTSTPFAADTPTAAPTDTPTITPTPLGTPIIIFAPAEKELEKGECTMVRWNVQNVREVYYENLPMNGQGEREECINDEDEIYTLMVVLPNGSPQIYTTTVSYLPPTPTPTMTPVFTPEPVHTPTWTPEPPTPTAPPNLFYAVNLAAQNSEITCAAGQTCDVGLLVTNGGSGTDNVSVLLLANDAFSFQLCRPDGVCGGNSVPINNMGAGNTAFVAARVSVPADAAAQSRAAATFQARSDGSGGGVTSSPIGVTVVVP
jgi:hypothetical protein